MPGESPSLRIIRSADAKAVTQLLDRARRVDPSIERRVAAIVEKVRLNGDRALLAYARRFDKLTGSIEVTRREIEDGAAQTPRQVRDAIATAARHIRAVAKHQVPKGWRTKVVPGVEIEQRVSPLERVGCYVPGGRYPLPSSLLMTAVAARVAGVREVIVACPRPTPPVLAAALEAGVTRLFRMGGAHAIAALAYGTETVPRVDKIAGPGNAYVAAGKARVAPDCPIDMHAGPSEIAVVSAHGNPEWIAADLIAQAEHDPDARAVLFTPHVRLAVQVAAAVARALPRHPAAAAALAGHGGIIVTRTTQEAMNLANRMAPEHLVCDDERMAAAVTHAGAVFVGSHAAQAAGDYATGSNHVLPTGGAARTRGGLSAADFVRTMSVQRVTKAGLARIAPVILALADAEGLAGHAASIAVRVEGRTTRRGGGRASRNDRSKVND